MLHVQRVADLAPLTVGYIVQAEFDLTPNDVRYCIYELLIERSGFNLPIVCETQCEQSLGTGETTGMRCPDDPAISRLLRAS